MRERWNCVPAKSKKLHHRTLWHFNNLISNYIINIFICPEKSNIMDIIEAMFTFIDYSEKQVKSMIASGIILIESINQTRASRTESEKNSLTTIFFAFVEIARCFREILAWTFAQEINDLGEWLTEFRENCATKPFSFYNESFFSFKGKMMMNGTK